MSTISTRKSAEQRGVRVTGPAQVQQGQFAPIGIQAVAAAAVYGSRKSVKHNEVKRELPAVLREENLQF